jgi:hypothetical protein
VVDSAPRVHPALLAALEQLDDPRLSIAELHRELGRLAHRFGLPRPSYERVRQLVHEHRSRRLPPHPARPYLLTFLAPHTASAARRHGLL